MRINLSRLSGNAEDNKELLHIDGDLPKKRRNLIGPFEGTARIEQIGRASCRERV